MSAPVKSLLVRCDRWLVALPVSCVRRLAAEDTVTVVAGAADDSPWLGTVAVGGERLPAWDLGRLLGLAGGGGAWVLIDRPLPAALRVRRCLHVVDLAPEMTRPLPSAAGGLPGASCFAAADGGFGLAVDPRELLAEAALAGVAPAGAGTGAGR